MIKKLIEQYNNFDGKKITREDLKKFYLSLFDYLPESEVITEIRAKIGNLLDSNKSKLFKINLQDQYLEYSENELVGLGIPFIKNDSHLQTGLNKAVSPNEIYNMITEMVIEMLESQKTIPWHKPWTATGSFRESATNLKTKTVYSGINDFLLNVVAPYKNKKPFNSQFFLSFKQMQELGGSLKKDAKGHVLVYYSKIYTIKQTEPKISFSTSDLKKYDDFINKNKTKITDKATKSRFSVLKYFKVFSLDDITGIKLPKVKKAKETKFENIKVAEAIVKNMPNPPKLKLESASDSAFYWSADDSVTMPKKSFFDKEQFYYSVFFHELIHSTGNKKRLGRSLENKFGSTDYAFEELIAEFGALFLCAEAGILYKTIDNSAAYIESWKKTLIKNAKKDNKFIFKAVSKSKFAADYLLARNEKGEPKYLDKLINNHLETTSKFTLNELPKKFQKTIFRHSKAELKRHENSTDKTLMHAVINMISLFDENLMVLLNFKNGYYRNTDKPIFYNVPTLIYRKLYKKEMIKIDKKILIFLKDKLEEYKYETAWSEYNFNGKNFFEIAKIVRYNIKSISKYLEQFNNNSKQLGLFGLNGVKENVDTAEFKNMTVSELRNFTLNYYKKFLNGKNIDIENRISKIEFRSKNGRKLARGGIMYASKGAVISKLEGLIKRSTYNNWGNRKTTDHKDIIGFLNFKSKLTIDGEKRRIRISIEVWRNGDKVFKNYDVGAKKKSSASKGMKPLDGETEPCNKNIKKTSKTKGLNAVREVILDVPALKPREIFLEVPVINNVVETPDLVNAQNSKNKEGANLISNKNKPLIRNVEKVIDAVAKSVQDKNNPYKSTAEKSAIEKPPVKLFHLKNEHLAKLLGNIEIKPKHSLVVTLDSKAGGGKTHTCYQTAQAFAESGYKPILWSLEEHEQSNLAEEKKEKYFDDNTRQIISVESEDDNLTSQQNYNRIINSAKYFDVILIDSLTKLKELNSKMKLDRDIRKAFDGKLFVLIVQRTSSGKMRGGSEAEFDGDIILKVDVDENNDFRNNFIYNEKNRYNKHAPLSELKYSPYYQELVNDKPKEIVLNV